MKHAQSPGAHPEIPLRRGVDHVTEGRRQLLWLCNDRPGLPVIVAQVVAPEPEEAVGGLPDAVGEDRRFGRHVVLPAAFIEAEHAPQLPPFSDRIDPPPEPERPVRGLENRPPRDAVREPGMRLKRPPAPVKPGRGRRTVLAAHRPEFLLPGHNEPVGGVHQPVFNPVARPPLSVEPHDASILRTEPERPVCRLTLKGQPFGALPPERPVLQPDHLLQLACDPERPVRRL